MATNYQKKTYAPGASVKNAYSAYTQKAAQKPADYSSRWKKQLDDTMAQILNREDFSYDVNGDALYRQYRDSYTRMGRQAMEDTVGQAAALTGGYGNSYAQTAGQQVYSGYMQQLNDRIPELYALALEQYNADADALYDRYALLQGQEAEDYSRYTDALSGYQAELERLYGNYLQERTFDYGAFTDGLEAQYRADRDAAEDAQWAQEQAYRQQLQQAEHERWLAEFEEGKRQWDQEQAYQQSQLDSKKALEAAQLLADAGDYSLLAQYYGLTPEQLALLQGNNRYAYVPTKEEDEDNKPQQKPAIPTYVSKNYNGAIKKPIHSIAYGL